MKTRLLTTMALTMGLVLGMAGTAMAEEGSDSGQQMQTMGQHTMAGTVTSIDHKTGWLRLKTGLGTLRLHYPPPTVKDVKKGDKMTAHLGFTTEK